MSTMIGDDWYPEEYDQQFDAELYEEHRKKALEEFTVERLQSFYRAHPDVAKAALAALADARRLAELHSGAAMAFAGAALELAITTVLLRPVVHGLVHQESIASLIADLAVSHRAFDRFQGLLFHILSVHGGIDLKSRKRSDSNELLWSEINHVRKKRNAVLHRGEQVTREDVDLGIAVASMVLEELVPEFLARLGLHLHNTGLVCGNETCA